MQPPNQPQNLLTEELTFYEKHRETFLHQHTNRHLLIKGSQLIGAFATHKQAVNEGIRQFGRGPFLVRLSGEDTPTIHVPTIWQHQ